MKKTDFCTQGGEQVGIQVKGLGWYDCEHRRYLLARGLVCDRNGRKCPDSDCPLKGVKVSKEEIIPGKSSAKVNRTLKRELESLNRKVQDLQKALSDVTVKLQLRVDRLLAERTHLIKDRDAWKREHAELSEELDKVVLENEDRRTEIDACQNRMMKQQEER